MILELVDSIKELIELELTSVCKIAVILLVDCELAIRLDSVVKVVLGMSLLVNTMVVGSIALLVVIKTVEITGSA